MTKRFSKNEYTKITCFTTEDGIKIIKEFFGKLIDWKNINDLIPGNFKKGNFDNKRTGKAGIFAGSLELVKEGNITIANKKIYLMKFILKKSNEKIR